MCLLRLYFPSFLFSMYKIYLKRKEGKVLDLNGCVSKKRGVSSYRF